MLLETFRGRDLSALFRQACAELGDDVLIVRTRVRGRAARREYEMVTTTPREVARLRSRLRANPLPSVEQHRASRRPPFVVALVGPGGTARADALATLATEAGAFGEWTVGVLVPTTTPADALHRLSASEVLRDLPVEVVSREADLEPAIQRLQGCDAILVDAPVPDAGPRAAELGRTALERLAPDETHLVLRADTPIADVRALVALHRWERPSHLLLDASDCWSESDELAAIAEMVALPVRWVMHRSATGVVLRPAIARILGALRSEPASLVMGGTAW